MEENINALNELSKGAQMGIDAITYVLNKIEDEKFKKSTEVQLKKYQTISKKIDDTFSKYKDDSPRKTSIMNKAMTWYGIEKRTLKDNSNSSIAELLLKGTNMGIIEGRKLLNNKLVDDEIHSLIEEYVSMQENSVEQLKKFL